jgi:diacylglycerol kinase (ATP)
VRSLVFVVNPRSGGRAGAWLLARLHERLPAERVMSIDEISLSDLARALVARGETVGVIACGGDGTAAAVAEACWQVSPLQPVPVGTIPLGTGNDLARSLGWRPHRRALAPDRLDHQIHALQVGPLAALDRWVVTGAGISQSFYNYLSLGADARVAARFHTLREDQPWMFRSPLLNKALYGLISLSEPALNIHDAVGGLPLPPWTRAVIFANIPSYAGGSRLGADIRADDGWIDGFALGGGSALGLAVCGLRPPHCFMRDNIVRFSLNQALLIQVDGEPLRLAPGQYTIAHGGRVRVITLPV